MMNAMIPMEPPVLDGAGRAIERYECALRKPLYTSHTTSAQRGRARRLDGFEPLSLPGRRANGTWRTNPAWLP
jgi:hypothetical protein